MDTRITTSTQTEASVTQLARQTVQLQQLQKQLSSGLRIQKPSDDPAGIRRSIIQKDRVDRFEEHINTLDQGSARLGQAHTQLRDAQQIFVRATEISLTGRQATDDSEINILAEELDGLLGQLSNIANSSDHNGFLFGGTRTDSRPFPDSISTSSNSAYGGTSDSVNLYITSQPSRTSLQPGLDVFIGEQRGEVVLIENNGLTTSDGQSSAVGFRDVSIRHQSTTYAVGSGIAVGSSSAGSDTIIGATGTHSLVINDTSGTGTSGTISLNGGEATAFSNSDTNLKVVDTTGQFVYVDTQSITAGFNGSVDITANGAVSVDGGLTEQNITFTDNQLVTDSRDGGAVYLNTTAAHNTSRAKLEFTGTFDAFQSLVALRDDLLNTRGLTISERNDALGRRIDDINRIDDQLLNEIGVQSVNLESFQRMKTLTEDRKLAYETTLADITSVDFAKAAVQLQEVLNLQQVTMTTIGRITSANLSDFLR